MKLLFISVFAILISLEINAKEYTIEMLNKDGNKRMVYSHEILKIDLHDTVTWVPTSKGHNVQMMASPNNLKLRSKNNKKVSIKFDTPGIYYYLCTPHKYMGMIGLVVVGKDISNKSQIESMIGKLRSKKVRKKLEDLLEQL